MALTTGGQAVYDELSGRKGVLDDIDDDEIVAELCEATASAVLHAVFPGDPELVAELTALTPPSAPGQGKDWPSGELPNPFIPGKGGPLA